MKQLAWPNGKRVAVSIKVMFETWADDKAPGYTVQTTPAKAGTLDHAAKAWSTYGGRVGIWRILRMLEQLKIPATVFPNARCCEEYPEAVRASLAGGHDLAAHAYTQDQRMATMTPDEQLALVKSSTKQLADFSGAKIAGWATPGISITPETAGLIAQAGLTWHTDVTYLDLPHVQTTAHGKVAGVPSTDFSDLRVLRANTRDFYDVYKGAFDYLYKSEECGLVVMLLHCHFGGRPMMAAAVQDVLEYYKKHDDVWFAKHGELARWALDNNVDEARLRARFQK